jgi:hypothetical protein
MPASLGEFRCRPAVRIDQRYVGLVLKKNACDAMVPPAMT